MSEKLAGRTALITGAATGMGQATAIRFAKEGARVVLFGLGGAALDETASMTNGTAVHGDVTSNEDVARAIIACNDKLDIVVNAAGIILMDRPETLSNETWERSSAVNTSGVMRTCRAALPLLKRRGGSIVNVSSVAAFNASPNNSAYVASKAAIVSYTRTVALAHGLDRIRANVVAPGWVRTPMSEMEMETAARESGRTPESEFAALASRIALRRVGEAEEIAACCLFLASDEASFVTGSVLVVDGGGRSPTHNRAA